MSAAAQVAQDRWIPTSALMPRMTQHLDGTGAREAKSLLRELEEAGVLESTVRDGEWHWRIAPEWLSELQAALG